MNAARARSRAGRLRVLAVLLCLLAPGALAADAPQQLRQLRLHIEALQKTYRQTQSRHAQAVDALHRSEQAISRIDQRLRTLSLRAQATQASLVAAAQAEARLHTRIARSQALLSRLLYWQYTRGRPDPLLDILNQRNPNQLEREAVYQQYLARAWDSTIGELSHDLARSQALERETQAQKRQLTRLAASQATARASLALEERTRRRSAAELGRKLGSEHQEISHLQANEKRLTQLIERLRALQRERRLAAHRRHAAGIATGLPNPALAGIRFARLKGRLHLPVVGELTHRFGSPRGDGETTWQGLFISAPAGTPVHAIASGEVVFASRLRGFGNLIIIDHGSGYMSLYADNESLYKRAGERVRPGDTIAAVGNSGGIPETGLYFELRYESKPFDPLRWMAHK
ncbi:MAG: peptidoglycan DD-metalloendopeptidase family protein [Betaproteobacteria bacterium]|nr:peptidoglycan DD-metalloendopeptidase family protein [Betaproteobacteria bacterium]